MGPIISDFILINNGKDLSCPYCNAGFDVGGWQTEIGDPIWGKHETKCENCGGLIKFEVSIKYSVLPEKN